MAASSPAHSPKRRPRPRPPQKLQSGRLHLVRPGKQHSQPSRELTGEFRLRYSLEVWGLGIFKSSVGVLGLGQVASVGYRPCHITTVRVPSLRSRNLVSIRPLGPKYSHRKLASRFVYSPTMSRNPVEGSRDRGFSVKEPSQFEDACRRSSLFDF